MAFSAISPSQTGLRRPPRGARSRPPLQAGKPEMREYRARYLQRDQATGDWSDIVTATFIP